jgi:hypothetical protein
VEGLRRNLYESITLKRGLTVDRAFNNWAGDGGKVAHGPAWVSGYRGLPDFASNSNAIAIRHIQFEHEGLVFSGVR